MAGPQGWRFEELAAIKAGLAGNVGQDGQWRFARCTFHLRYEDDVAVPERLLGITAPSLSGR
ncbi:hypothetical protein F0U61_34565 [Archangium violaceum]|uniref:hypothetical protein n=1 Tax=Archangium violaceum TaxID=83451 RepID=UPI002B2C1DF2|nr:hypothetical protein F0U61_34565 [Archangium violaceum]